MFARRFHAAACWLALLVSGCSPAPNVVDPWTTDLAKMTIPETPVTGRVAGRDFKVEDTEYASGARFLTFRQGKDFFPDAAAKIALPLEDGESPEAREFEFGPELTFPAPVIFLEHNYSGQNSNEGFGSGYALRLEFGQATGSKLPGKIYLCLPDKEKSFIFGTFSADMK